MATETNLNREKFSVLTGNDGIVIVQAVTHYPCGISLNVDDLDESVKVISAGHILIREDATGEVKPLGVTSAAYDTLPSGYSYFGVLKATLPRDNAQASVVTSGVINAAASPYPVTSAIKAGLPLIQFIY